MSNEPDTIRRKLFGSLRSNLAAIDRVKSDTDSLRAELAILTAELQGANSSQEEGRRSALDAVAQITKRIDNIENLRLRTFSLLLSELEGRVVAVESGSEGVRQRLDLAQVLDAQAAAELTRLDEGGAQLARQIAGVRAEVADHSESNRATRADVHAQDRKIGDLQEQVIHLETQTRAEAAQARDDHDSHGRNLAYLRSLVGELESQAQAEADARTALAREVRVLDQRREVAALKAGQDVQGQGLDALRDLLSALELRAQEEADARTELEHDVRETAERTSNLENAIRRLDDGDALRSTVLSGLADNISSAHVRIADNAQMAAAAHAKIDQLQAHALQTSEELSRIDTQGSVQGQEMAQVRDSILAVSSRTARSEELIAANVERLAALEGAATQSSLEATRLDRAIAGQSTRATELDWTIKTNEARVSTLEQKVDGIVSVATSAASRAESLLEASIQRMSALESATVQAALEATRLDRAISSHSTRTVELDWALKASSAKIATLEEKIESLVVRLQTSEQRHVETGQELNRIESAAQKAVLAPAIAKSAGRFDGVEDLLPPPSPDVSRDGEGRPRSAIFLHNSYYHFYYLAQALRERGWDAWSVSVEQPDGPHSLFYHGQDLSLWDADHTEFASRIGRFNDMVERRFKWLQFCGDGMMTVSPWKADGNMLRDREPTEFIKFRQAGVKIGYTISGCGDGYAQSTWNRWTGDRCKMCRFKGVEEVCSDLRNLAWAHKRNMFCDLIAAEQMPRLDYNNGPKVYSEPLTMALDEKHWRPGIKPPKKYAALRAEGEILVFHAVGAPNDVEVFGQRTLYKGTPAIVEAVEALRAEGIPIRLLFSEAVPSVDMRFLQVQADIIVDQLNFTRYGAFAREALMLGKPVVARLESSEENGPPLKSLEECPIVHADLSTIKDVLRALALDPDRRRKLGEASRKYAMKWHSAGALAERFERVYDHVMAGGDPASAAFQGAEAAHH